MGPIRISILIALALWLGACEPRSASSDCTLSASNDISFADTGVRAELAANATGESCLHAAVSLDIKSGDTQRRYESTYYAMIAGGAPSRDAPPVAADEVEAFLVRWAEATAMTSDALPAWASNMAYPGEGVSGLPYRSSLPRDEYEAYRARALPTLCIATGVDAVECVIIDGAAITPVLGYQP